MFYSDNELQYGIGGWLLALLQGILCHMSSFNWVKSQSTAQTLAL